MTPSNWALTFFMLGFLQYPQLFLILSHQVLSALPLHWYYDVATSLLRGKKTQEFRNEDRDMEVLQFQMGRALLLPLAFSANYSGIFFDIYMYICAKPIQVFLYINFFFNNIKKYGVSPQLVISCYENMRYFHVGLALVNFFVKFIVFITKTHICIVYHNSR